MNTLRSVVKNIVALLAGCIAAFLIAEIILQMYNPFSFRVKGDKIILPANQKYVMKSRGSGTSGVPGKFDDVIIHTKNSLGFRGDPPPASFDDYLTVITVGGSTTECTFISDGKTWTDVMGRKLVNDFERLWINNAGFDGHSTFGHIVLVKDFIIRLHPDVVLLLVGANDQGKQSIGEYDKEFMKNEVMFKSLKWFVKSMANHSEVFSLGVNLYRYVQANLIGVSHREFDFARLKHAHLHTVNAAVSRHQEEALRSLHAKPLQGYTRRLQILVDLLKKNNIAPVLITQPTLYGDLTYDVDGTSISHGKDQMKILEFYNDVTRRTGMENDVLVVDLAAELPKNTKYYYDFYHFTNEGSEKVAGIIYEKLRPYLEKRYAQYAAAR